MFKSSKSYSKKASHKREVTGGASGGSDYHHIQGNGGPLVTSPPPSVRNGSVRNEAAYGQRSSSASKAEGKGEYSESHYVRGAGGQLVPIHGERHYEAGAYGGQAFSESSAYETHEHYERKIKKKTRGERDRRANGFSNGSLRKVGVSLNSMCINIATCMSYILLYTFHTISSVYEFPLLHIQMHIYIVC